MTATTQPNDEARSVIVDKCPGRDSKRRYRLAEIDPLTMSGYMLRLVSALRVDSLDSTYAQLQDVMTAPSEASGSAGDAAVNAMFKLLGGCDPTALHALITDLLKYVEVARDPNHPNAWMALDVAQDMREMKTLATVLRALVALNFRS